MTSDLELVKLVAAEAARNATEQTLASMRIDLSASEKRISDSVAAQMKSYFGTMQPSEHLIDHNNLTKLLRFTDRLGEGIIGKGIMMLLIIAGVAAVIMGFIWTHLKALIGL